MTARWTRTPAWWRALGVAATGALLALLLRRPDLVVLISPLAVAAAIDWRAPTTPAATLRTSAPPVAREGDVLAIHHHLCGVPAGAVVAILAARGDRPATRLLSASETLVAESAAPVTWGVHTTNPAAAHAITGWAGWSAGVDVAPLTTTVLPRRHLPLLATLPHPVGVGPGPHPGLRTGTGTDFAGLHPLSDGEPARRVNWAATLRMGGVVVNQTKQDTTGAYLILLEAGPDPLRHDDIVHTLAGLCARLLRDGAYVALGVHGCGDVAPVRLGAGPRHLARLETSLAHATARPHDPASDHQHRRIDRTRLPMGTVVLAFTPLLDSAFLAMLVRLDASQRRVTAIDTRSWTGTAVDELEHRVRHLDLQSRGIPVTTWHSPSATINAALGRLRGRAAS